MSNISVVDLPVQSYIDEGGNLIRRRTLAAKKGKEKLNNPDTLKTGKYAESLAHFIRKCATPLTIGIQGEWGSGKTSLLNMIREEIEEEVDSFTYLPSGGKKSKTVEAKGNEIYKSIWINTWEHSLLKSPEECLLSIIEEIIVTITQVDDSWNTADKAKKALGALAAGALRVGASVALGNRAADVAEEFLGDTGGNSIKNLRNTLTEITQTIIKRDKNTFQRFVIYIDDLDRIDPPVAVMILELLKNIFTIENCVFVVAIDYQVIVKGLKGKFGEPNKDNEWEFRAFFDKIIQLPFMMPVVSYDVQNYVANLLSSISFLTEKDQAHSGSSEIIKDLITLSLGRNPRALKRLVNSLSLINIHHEDALNNDDKREESRQLKHVVFALVCCQISYPRIYELLIRSPYFWEWDDEFVGRVTGGKIDEDKETAKALSVAMIMYEDDFDEEWEQALFKIVWLKKWQRDSLTETSRLLSIIKDTIFDFETEEGGKKNKFQLKSALKMTAVTSVSSTEDGVFTRGSKTSSQKSEGIDRYGFWSAFSKEMNGTNTVFDLKGRVLDRSQGYFRKQHDEVLNDKVQFVVETTSTRPLRVTTFTADPDNYKVFLHFKKYKDELEGASKGKVKIVAKENQALQHITFFIPEMKTGIDLSKPDKDRKYPQQETFFTWLKDVLPNIEEILIRAAKEIDDEGYQDEGYQVSTE